MFDGLQAGGRMPKTYLDQDGGSHGCVPSSHLLSLVMGHTTHLGTMLEQEEEEQVLVEQEGDNVEQKVSIE